jgi:hypothetical protein
MSFRTDLRFEVLSIDEYQMVLLSHNHGCLALDVIETERRAGREANSMAMGALLA